MRHGATNLVRGETPTTYTRDGWKQLAHLLLLMNWDVLFPLGASCSVSLYYFSLSCTRLSAKSSLKLEVLATVLVGACRGSVVAVFAVSPQTFLWWDLSQRLHLVLEGVSRTLVSDVLGDWVMLLDELVNRHETATHSDDQVVVLHFHDHLLCEVVVVTIAFSHKQALHPFLGIRLIDELG